jgi:hypothetical protein
MSTPVYKRLRLHRNWAQDIPLKFLWVLFISPRNGRTLTQLGESIKRVINEYEVTKTGSWPVKTDLLENINDSTGQFGVLLAQNVVFPQDAFNIEDVRPGGGANGYLGLPTSGQRGVYGGQNNLNITFLETNIDVFDYFIRPWIIAGSYKGMIELGEEDENDLKCNMQVVLFTRDFASYNNNLPQTQRKLEIRKVFEFDNVIPYQVKGDALSYGEMTSSNIERTVTFAFTRYRTIDNNSIPIKIDNSERPI